MEQTRRARVTETMMTTVASANRQSFVPLTIKLIQQQDDNLVSDIQNNLFIIDAAEKNSDKEI